MSGGRDRSGALLRGVYGAALWLCPRAMRQRHGDDMHATFDDLCRDARRRGRLAVLALVARELTDLASASIAARRHQPSTVSQEPSRQEPSRLRSVASPPSDGVARRSATGEKAAAVSHVQRRSDALSSLLQDLRYAARMLRRQPGFTLVATLTLALGIGANTGVFTVVNGVLLRPLPYQDPDRLVVLLYGRPGRVSPWFSPPNYHDFVSQSGAFQDAAAFAPSTANLTGGGDPERIDGASVSWNYFNVLGVAMRAGRGFVESEGAGDGGVVVIGDGLWRRRYGGRDDAIGSTIRLDGRGCTIVGIAPAELKLPANAEFWKPLIFKPTDLAPAARGAQWISVIARLKTGTDVDQATAALQTVAARLAATFSRINGGATASAVPLHARMVRDVRQTLIVLLGAVSFVLLIACVNVANLLLARGQSRSREVAVRSALGAGRARLVRQFLSESILLGLLGGSAGLAVAFWCTRALVALGPATIPRLAEVTIDLRVLGFTIAIAVATSVVFGLVPAWNASGGARWVNAAGRGSVGGSGTGARRALVVCELALAVVLLVGAGLLLRSYERLQHVNPGFDPDGVVTFNLSLSDATYPTVTHTGAFVTALVSRLQGEPGVEATAVVFGLPFAGAFSASTSFRRPSEADVADSPSAGLRIVTPDYFRTMRIPMIAGRLFDGHDDDTSTEVALINRRTAQKFFADVNPIGQQIRVGVRLARGARSNDKTIVGIVGDVKYGSLEAETPPEIYLPYAQHQVDEFSVAVRTAGDPMTFAPTLRRDVAAIDRELPIAKIEPMTAVIGASIAERRFTMFLLAAFAAVALALATIGVYGVLAYLVTQRTQEIGVRLALGAAPDDVVRLFVREGARLTVIGLAAGVAGALAAARALSTLVFGVTTTDPTTFIAVSGALLVVALLASYVPARRAAAVDPMTALRAD
jgi:putative ABC transport system permease protein